MTVLGVGEVRLHKNFYIISIVLKLRLDPSVVSNWCETKAGSVPW